MVSSSPASVNGTISSAAISNGNVGNVRREIDKEWFVRVRLDELHGRAEENVGAVAFVFLRVLVMVKHGVIIEIPGRIGPAADPRPLMDKAFLEALLLGPQGIVVPEVPLAEDPRPITRVAKQLARRSFAGRIMARPTHVSTTPVR